MRKVLREKQYAISISDDRYFRRVRISNLGTTLEKQDISSEQSTIAELLEDCQTARDEYGPLEDDCNLLEDQLGREEFELTRLEENFYRRQNEPETFRWEQPSLIPDAQEGSLYSESDIGHESHPLVSAFLSKLGDVDILRERLDDYIEEKFSLEYEKESRQRFGLDLAPDDQEWLDKYDNLESKCARRDQGGRRTSGETEAGMPFTGTGR